MGDFLILCVIYIKVEIKTTIYKFPSYFYKSNIAMEKRTTAKVILFTDLFKHYFVLKKKNKNECPKGSRK